MNTLKTKICSKCEKRKKIKEFHKDRTKKDGLHTLCNKCHCLNSAKYRKNNPSYNSIYCKKYRSTRLRELKNLKIKKAYGITIDEYEEIEKNQGGVCAICNGKNNDRRLAVDHCHTTGKVRGLLCGNCNRGIGYFKDSKILLEKTIKYLS